MNTKAKGYMYGAIAAATYGMNPLFTLPLYKVGMDPDSVLFLRYVLAIPILGLMLKIRGRSFSIHRNEIIPLAIMGILIALSSLMLFLSYNYMAAGIASTLLFVYPIIVAIIMAIFFKERITLQNIICIALALGGIALLYQDSEGATISLKGISIVMISALSYAIYIVGVNQSTLKNVATLKLTFYVVVFGTLLFFFRINFGQNLHIVNEWFTWINLIALAALPTALSFLCTTRAVQYIGSTPTAILGALEPLTAVFFGVLIFHETLNLRISVGIIMIIIAVICIIAGGNITTALIRFRKLFPRIHKK